MLILTDKMAADSTLTWTAPEGSWRVYRFGHTTNGKTNYGTAPAGGVGLECDKMSREALEHYWAGYPQMLHAGALNPWPDHKLGMTFGLWGTQWTSGQTWWQSGGATASPARQRTVRP